MKYSKLCEHQEALSVFEKPIEVRNGRVSIIANVMDATNLKVRYYIYKPKLGSEERHRVLEDEMYSLTPAELRWIADVVEHYNAWRLDKEDWPLPNGKP